MTSIPLLRRLYSLTKMGDNELKHLYGKKVEQFCKENSKIYVVQAFRYTSGMHDVYTRMSPIGYFLNKHEAQHYCKKYNKNRRQYFTDTIFPRDIINGTFQDIVGELECEETTADIHTAEKLISQWRNHRFPIE